MNKFLVAAAAGALLTTAALAQDHDRRGGNGGDQQNHEHHGGPPPHAAPAAPAPAKAPAPTARGQALQQNVQRDQERRDVSRGNRGPEGPRSSPPTSGAAMSGPRPNNPAPNGPRADFNGPRPGGNAPRSGFNSPRPGPRPDFHAYNRNFTAAHRFHAPAYHRPPGFYVHRWVYGDILPSPFWVRDYWLPDFADFDLPPPPPGTMWVRYGADALLIDRYSGEIIEVEYSVFY